MILDHNIILINFRMGSNILTLIIGYPLFMISFILKLINMRAPELPSITNFMQLVPTTLSSSLEIFNLKRQFFNSLEVCKDL